MRPVLPGLLLTALLTGCGGDSSTAASTPSATDSSTAFSAEVRENFLTSCVQNARAASNGAADDEQLTRTCECILGKVEQEYSESEFSQFEQRLLGDTASDEETAQLTQWSTSCADEAAG